MKNFSQNSKNGRKTLRQLLQENPDSGQVVIGDGTVHMDPDEIRNSESYKELCEKLKQYCKDNNL